MKQNDFDKNMSAITFAEAGEHDTARSFLKELDSQEKAPQAVKKPWNKTVFLGAISLVSYIVLFKNQAAVMELFTAGGVSTIYPILTVFFFSFVHGAFGSNLLSCLGLEAKTSSH